MPFFLITGAFLADLAVTMIAFYILYLVVIKKINFDIDKKIIFFFIIFYFVINISSILSFDPALSLKSSLLYIRHFLFLVGGIYFLKTNPDLKNNFLKVLLILFTILFFDGLIQFFYNKNIIGIPKFEIARLTSFFGDEPILGSYIFRLYPLLIYLIYDQYKEKEKKFLILIFIYSLGSLLITYLSGERKAFILLLVYNFGILFLNKKIFKNVLLSLIIFLTLALFINNNYKHVKDRMISKTYKELKIFKNNDSKINKELKFFSEDHHSHYVVALNLFLTKPLFGHGIKSFRALCSKKDYSYSPKKSGCSTHPHNYYLQLLSETGLFAFFLILFLFLIIFYKLLCNFIFYLKNKMYINNSKQLMLLGWLFLILLPFTPHGNFFNNWLTIINFLPLSFLIYESKS